MTQDVIEDVLPTVTTMLLHLTVLDAHDATERSVEVRAQAGHTLRDVARALGLSLDQVVVVDGTPVPVDAPVGLPPLLDGAVLVVGRDADVVMKSTAAAPLRLITASGPDAGRGLALTPGRHVIGRGERASLRLADDALSREHFSLSVDRDGVLVHDLGTTNGTLVGADPVPAQGIRVRAGDRLRAGHTTFVVEAHRPRPSRRRPTGRGTLAVNPVPRLPAAASPVRITMPPEPRPPARRTISWLMVLLPLPFAGLLAFFFGPRMLLFGLLTPLLGIASVLSDRSSARHEHRAEREAWLHERARVGERLVAALALERRSRELAAPDAMTVLDAARGHSPRLWERRPGHDEHLDLRVGLATLPARLEVAHGTGERAHPVLEQVPLVVPLATAGVLGIAGGVAERARLAAHLLGQLIVLHSHHDVRVSIVAGDEGWWSPFAGLVHLREHDDVPGSVRVATDVETASALISRHAQTVEQRAATRPGEEAAESATPVEVLVIDQVDRWRTDPRLRTVLTHGPDRHVLVIALADAVDALPHECGAVVRVHHDEVLVDGVDAVTVRGVVDGVGISWCLQLAAAVMPLRDATPDPRGGGLPTSSRLLDLLALDPDDPEAIRSRWSRTADGPVDLDVVVGAGPDGDFRIDLRRDGPHALVAGTTGSGKSEFLQSWIAALAVHLSPEQINFVLVDYKGGAAFAECARLPHTVGLLTDLDPEQAERALTSLDAELTRRERILAASGASDIDDHRGLPLPRLVIVIDEFRMLAEEQPDALSHLMRIAAVGRSLGVHLVLATQRPGGIVSADIRANVNLRIALRVRDRVDSDDVIGTGDAVDVPEESPGRALARTSGAPPRPFQTGRVAGHAPSASTDVVVRDIGQPWPDPEPTHDLGPTDLCRVVATVTDVTTGLGLAAPHRPWLPPLPDVIATDELPARAPGEEGAPFALLDRPEQQRQEPVCWTPQSGHWMVVGGPGTGRTSAAASLVTAVTGEWSAERLHVQVIGDGSSLLSELALLPHVGSVVDGEDAPVLRRFLARLEHDVTERRGLLRASGHPTLEAWWSAVDEGSTTPPPPPYLLLVVDAWSRVADPRSPDLGETAERLEAVLREGTAVGMRAFVTGGRELLSGRISSLIGNRLVLHLPDRGDASLAGLRPTQLSTSPVPGRAHRQPGGELVQIALPAATARSGPESELRATVLPWQVLPLPDEADLGSLTPSADEQVVLGVGGAGQDPVVWRTGSARRLLVCGPAGSGRTTTLATVAHQALAAGQPVAVIGDEVLMKHPGLDSCFRVDPEDRDGLIALRREHPTLVVLIDDADRVDHTPVSDVLAEIVRRVDADRGLVVASTSTRVASTQVRGLVADMARDRSGILLQPTSRADGDAFGLRVPPLPRRPGRGYLVVDGQAQEVQVARLPDPCGPVPGRPGRTNPCS